MAQGEPRFYLSEGRLTVPVVEMPSEDVREEIERTFTEVTGFEIDWESPATGS